MYAGVFVLAYGFVRTWLVDMMTWLGERSRCLRGVSVRDKEVK